MHLLRGPFSEKITGDHDAAKTVTGFWRDPAMPFVESRRACHSRACYKPHNHPTFSIGAVDAGSSRFTGASGSASHLQPGMMVFIPAGNVHACNPLPDRSWSYQMLHLDAAWLGALLAEGALKEGALLSESEIRIINNAEVYRRFCALNTLLFSEKESEAKADELIAFLGDCYCGMEMITQFPAIATRQGPLLQRVMDVLQQAEAPMWSLEALANLAGLSRYQLIRLFRNGTGMTPHAWQINIRINQARQWLQAGWTLTDIAYRLGFADQSHFQRVFKAHTGITPGGYRA